MLPSLSVTVRGIFVGASVALLSGIFGCSSTEVLSAPHAASGLVATGVVLNKTLGRQTVSTGVVAVSEARRGDLVWRVTDGGRGVQLCHPGGCVAPEPVAGTEMPKRGMWFLEAAEVRPVTPRAGVWLSAGGVLGYVHYCWIEGDKPLCEALRVDGKPVIATGVFSTQSIRQGGLVEDVVWASLGPILIRCHRGEGPPECRTVAPKNED